jgi:hypothetical protein
LNQIKANLEKTQGTMTQFLSTAITRQEEPAAMGAKAEDIRNAALFFRREAEKLKCQSCCAKWRWHFLGASIVLVLIVVVVLIVCEPNFSSCKSKKDDGNKKEPPQ